ncbi:MAG: hypothetical protein ACK5YR_01040 [Pirellula sp.]|jgi:hypothetical protein
MILVTVLVVAKISPAQDHWQDPPMGSIRLTENSPIAEGQEVNRKVLDATGVDRALPVYRVQAGLPTRDAKPLGGWAVNICSHPLRKNSMPIGSPMGRARANIEAVC